MDQLTNIFGTGLKLSATWSELPSRCIDSIGVSARITGSQSPRHHPFSYSSPIPDELLGKSRLLARPTRMHKSCLANGWLALLSTSILDPFMS